MTPKLTALVARLEAASSSTLVPTCLAAAAALREQAREIERLNEQNAEFLSQAEGGLMIDHDCPAVFACAYILSELTPESEKVDAQREGSV